MICFIALIVFGILGVFSVTYRKVAWEAFDCVFRKTTFRKCRSNLDERLKSQIIGRLMRKNAKTARVVFKNFEIISFIFTILLIVSMVYSAYASYNFVRYGNCNGPGEEFCIFDAVIDNPFGGDDLSCSVTGAVQHEDAELTAPDVTLEPFIGKYDSGVTVVEFGCYSCPYSREAQLVVKKVIGEYRDRIKFVFLHFPIEVHENSKEIAIAAECARDQGKFWEYHELLFSTGDSPAEDDLVSYAEELGFDIADFNECLDGKATENYVDDDLQKGLEAGVYGTPTFFINGESLVGPQSLRQFRKIINKELAKN
jgi:protein-disulfide isomerase